MGRNRPGHKRKPDNWDYGNGKGKEGENVPPRKQPAYESIIKENALFEKYYRQLNLIDPSEFECFMHTLKQPLPIAFRITSYKSFSSEILRLLKEKHFKYIDEITKNENAQEVYEASANKGASLLTASNKEENAFLNQEKEIYKRLTWYPDELGWQVNLSRQDVRKNAHFEEFKQFLIHHTQNGHLSRQESVSMIPPLLLNVEPHHKVFIFILKIGLIFFNHIYLQDFGHVCFAWFQNSSAY